LLLILLATVCMCLLAPSPARDVVVDPKHLDELHISWNPPLKPNGEVTHYYVYWRPQPLHAQRYHQRNYCDDSKCQYLSVVHLVTAFWLGICSQSCRSLFEVELLLGSLSAWWRNS